MRISVDVGKVPGLDVYRALAFIRDRETGYLLTVPDGSAVHADRFFAARVAVNRALDKHEAEEARVMK